MVENINEDWRRVLVVESKQRLILVGQMTGDIVEPYQEICLDVIELYQLDEDLEWSRDDIDAEELLFEVPLNDFSNFNTVLNDCEEDETNDYEDEENNVGIGDDI